MSSTTLYRLSAISLLIGSLLLIIGDIPGFFAGDTLGMAVYGLLVRSHPDSSLLGIAISIAAIVVMPGLGLAKRRLAARLESAALRGDADSSFTCGYMAATVLLG